MCRTFAYCRVSTTEQTTENQILAIRSAGYDVIDSRVVSETVSGSKAAFERAEFSNLVLNKMESGDRLIVLKLDRLGRDNIDVQQTVNRLSEAGVKLVCLDLPVSDLSSTEGKLMLQMFSAFAEFERNRIRERTIDGQKRARAQGKVIGRTRGSKHEKDIKNCRARGLSQSKTATELGIGIATVKRYWNK